MNVKEVIQYIAEEDLEINLTLQVGSETSESLKEEVRQLRKRIDELQISGNASLPEPEVSGEIEANEGEAPENIKEAFEEGTEIESDSVDEVPSEDDITERPDLEDVEPEPSESGDEETVSDEESSTDEGNKFDEMFGGDDEDGPTPSERRTPEDPPEEEPTPEERSEAGADFEELFGEV